MADIVVIDESWIMPFADFVTPRGLRELPDDLPYEDWERLGVYIGTVLTASKWALGDWLAFGEHRYGEKYAQAAAKTGRSEQGLMNIASTARAWPLEHRKGDYGIHEELSSRARDDIADATSILDRAIEGQWTREVLRAELAPSVTPAPAEAKLTVAEFEAAFERWPERTEHRNNLNKGFAAYCDWLRA